MGPQPTKLALLPDGKLSIEWSDGMSRQYLPGELRGKCPCATCREKRAQPPEPTGLFPVLTAAEAQPTKILGMEPVGNYAYSIKFNDGHDTGIYTLELLRELGQEV
jgi:DUF971 family protein